MNALIAWRVLLLYQSSGCYWELATSVCCGVKIMLYVCSTKDWSICIHATIPLSEKYYMYLCTSEMENVAGDLRCQCYSDHPRKVRMRWLEIACWQETTFGK